MWPHHDELVNVRCVTVFAFGNFNHAGFINEFFFLQGRSSMDMQFWHQKRSSIQKSLRSLRQKGFFMNLSFSWQALLPVV